MITVYELERRVPSYYGLCGYKMESLIYVKSESGFFNVSALMHHNTRMDNLKLSGWEVKRKRDFPIKLKTGGFTRRIN